MSNSPLKILVVDDEDISLMIAEHILKMAGYEVETASNGEEALAKIETTLFDLIFLDLEMPVLSGWETAPKIRELEHGGNVPVIALTGHTMAEFINKIADSPMDSYTTKPLDPEKVAAIVDEFII
jgi:CheY-like chemotaxis protein